METLKFKTNIKCGGCVEAVTPVLDHLKKIENWEVDTANPDKVLTVRTSEPVSASEIIDALKEKGYIAERI